MGIQDGINTVLGKATEIFQRRQAALYALSLYYAEKALQEFKKKQDSNDPYWENRTFSAMDLVFAKAFMEKTDVGWFIAHGVEYGPYLELANDGKNQALRPIINQFAQPFFDDAKNLYKD